MTASWHEELHKSYRVEFELHWWKIPKLEHYANCRFCCMFQAQRIIHRDWKHGGKGKDVRKVEKNPINWLNASKLGRKNEWVRNKDQDDRLLNTLFHNSCTEKSYVRIGITEKRNKILKRLKEDLINWLNVRSRERVDQKQRSRGSTFGFFVMDLLWIDKVIADRQNCSWMVFSFFERLWNPFSFKFGLMRNRLRISLKILIVISKFESLCLLFLKKQDWFVKYRFQRNEIIRWILRFAQASLLSLRQAVVYFGILYLVFKKAHISIRGFKLSVGDPALGETWRNIVGPNYSRQDYMVDFSLHRTSG